MYIQVIVGKDNRLPERQQVHMHMNVTAKVLAPPPLPCACASLRRATRAVTQLYDAALRPIGLRITQLTLLQVLERAGEPMTQGALGEVLALDSTTLTRTLRPLERVKWIRRVEGGDARERRFELATQGRRALARAMPAWERVQRRLRSGLGQRNWAALRELLTSTVAAVRRG